MRLRFVVIVDALMRGQKEGQHILTMSLGGADGWTEGTASVVASRIGSTGRIVSIAAGESWFLVQSYVIPNAEHRCQLQVMTVLREPSTHLDQGTPSTAFLLHR